MVVPSLIYKTGGAAVIPGISEAGKNKTREINPLLYACMYLDYVHCSFILFYTFLNIYFNIDLCFVIVCVSFEVP